MTLRAKAESAAMKAYSQSWTDNGEPPSAEEMALIIERVAREFAENALKHAIRFQIAQIEEDEPIPSRRRDLVAEAIAEAEGDER